MCFTRNDEMSDEAANPNLPDLMNSGCIETYKVNLFYFVLITWISWDINNNKIQHGYSLTYTYIHETVKEF